MEEWKSMLLRKLGSCEFDLGLGLAARIWHMGWLFNNGIFLKVSQSFPLYCYLEMANKL